MNTHRKLKIIHTKKVFVERIPSIFYEVRIENINKVCKVTEIEEKYKYEYIEMGIAMKNSKTYRRIVFGLLILSIAGTLFYGYLLIESKVPDQLTLFVNEEEEINFAFPANGETEDVSVFQSGNEQVDGVIHFDFSEPFSIKADATGNYKLLVKMFGFIKLKEMEINVVEPVKAMPIGDTIGIYVETDGVMVLGTGSVSGKDGVSYEPAANVIYSGDYILSVNGTSVSTIGELSSQIQAVSGEEVVLGIRRKGEEQKVAIMPVEAVDGSFKLGIWTREDTQGIGTLTYIDENNHFGALGHGITDTDTGLLMEIAGGNIYKAQILNIVKGESGEPGEMIGMINLSQGNKVGEIENNQEQGIFGLVSGEQQEEFYNEPLEIGLKQEIKVGQAQILCDLGDGKQLYDIEIEKLQINSNDINKSMVIRITDEELLAKTNGIVQGMSGSPIIQNNKLIGAVTHVFVQNPAKGYGIFIENMLEH